MLDATWTRLAYGRGPWGLKIAGRGAEGDVVSVKRRDGSSELRTVGRIVWQGWNTPDERGSWVTSEASAGPGDVCKTLAHAGDVVAASPAEIETVSGDVVPTETIQIGPEIPGGQRFRIGDVEISTSLHRMHVPPARSVTPHADRARARKAARSGGVRTTPGFNF
jgi:hypothetical protein